MIRQWKAIAGAMVAAVCEQMAAPVSDDLKK
jgi:hypothetical protein